MATSKRKQLSARARAQRNALMDVTNRIVVQAVLLLHGRGWSADKIASRLGGMQSAAGNAVLSDAATNAEIDYDTGEFQEDSLIAAIDVAAYAGHLAEAMCNDGGER